MKKIATYYYTPSSSPTATDLASIGKLTDHLEEEEQNRWMDASKQSKICESMTNEIGSFHSVEIDGNLHVKGNFNVYQHRIAALWIKGDLIVDGVYEDQAYPQSFVLIEGDLKATNIITGAQLEVHGDVDAQHLAGDYNDYSAKFFGNTTATTFFPENHNFEFSGDTTFALTLDGNPSPKSMDLYASAFIGEEFIASYGEIQKSALIKALAQGRDITHTDPSDLGSVTSINLEELNLKSPPKTLFSFTNLTELNLNYNKVSNLKGLEKLSKLKTLSVVSNPIRSFPKSLMTLPLENLNVGYWTDLPQWFSKWETLKRLDICVEELTELPAVVAEIPALTHLVLGDWPVESDSLLTDVVCNLPKMNLNQLSMSSGAMTHLPDNLQPFATLKVLELTEQSFEEKERLRIINALPNVEVRF